jgi:hypothetical protein
VSSFSSQDYFLNYSQDNPGHTLTLPSPKGRGFKS